MIVTLPQAMAIAIVVAMVAAFAWGRWRYDLVAIAALLASVAAGTVPAEATFSGFSEDVVVIVAGALVTSRAISRTGIVERLVRLSLAWLTTTGRQVAALTAIVMVLSAFVKNIGALSMALPAAYQFWQKTGTPASRLLMPMSFASLLGGIVTLVGTSPNVIVSGIRQDIVGKPFAMFDFAAVGLPLAGLGLAFLWAFYRLVPIRKTPAVEELMASQTYTVEAVVTEASPLAGQPARALVDLSGGDVAVSGIVRKTHTRIRSPAEQILHDGDHVLLHGAPADVDALIQRAGLALPGAGVRLDRVIDRAEQKIVAEAVIGNESLLVGWSPAQLRLSDRFAVEVLGVRRRNASLGARLKTYRFAAGDVVVIRSGAERLPEAMAELDLLPLATGLSSFGGARSWIVPVLVLAVAMTLMAAKVVSVPVAFVGAAAIVVACGVLSLKDAYDALDPPVLVTLAALIPVSDSLRSTGADGLISDWLSVNAATLPPLGALALIMVVAMAVTPFLNNAATVLVAAPIAAAMAQKLGYAPEPFLMAVALGAACDFLTPVGHQCNMLVMGPGGYRFGDYARLGLPLSLLVVVAGVPLIAWAWPVHP